MESIISTLFKKETKTTAAVASRSKNATLIEESDTLQLVYDVFTYSAGSNKRNSDTCLINFMFLHGSGMNRSVWEYYIAYMSKHFDNNTKWQINKMITLDQVTHGDSAEINRNLLGTNFDWADGARDACKVAQEEFLPKRMSNCVNVIVGHSMGGFQALSCGILSPTLFDLIIVIEPVVYVPHVENKLNVTIVPPRFYEALWNKMEDKFKDMNDFKKFMKKRSFYKNANAEIIERMIQFEAVHTAEGIIRTKISQQQNIICYLTLDPTAKWLIDSLPYINTPVYGIVGGKSTWCPPQNQELLVAKIPKYQKDIIPDGDHLLNLEDPGECLTKIFHCVNKFVDNFKMNMRKRTPNKDNDRYRLKLFEEQFALFKNERVKDGPIKLAKL
ncbi:similar to Saccharomyces cerevisiae YOR084W LPX1 Oleic acid-inducible, peroxisomal matrix localized lipase [Maudiozyma barnettii]|uniref:Similar to Saccharomyces cerevisiae YOR084W LPX1 Oleic acid-inducible, peroxisomal matrix localized lipase n=1 Tax=Maudiozyma barnettii TaxID=61262 RepID=A0A8H2VIE2_9SACH|nr:triglyceride lipase [Kazachstania barnettii]CAB4256256.1 similar to Saccharomyces cerevisiae YOR084W LPX1 Oleic acid-inducible, peroxisomal matrix localized lipase [Kazachstania barnettii]CAD1784865.1 similar to Saccharomyces cerevisiae YOR084W LPX1 Oleic acid-inducible, peroxisomal matrix localized lipase [Kazachstania barnettii]